MTKLSEKHVAASSSGPQYIVNKRK